MKSLLRVLGYLKPYKPYVAWTLGFAILTTLLDLVPPWLIKIIVDQLVEEQSGSAIYWVVLVLVLSYFGRNFSNYKRIRLNNELEQKVVFDLRSHVYRSLQKLSLKYYENRATGEIMSRVNDDVTYVERIFIDGIEQLVTAVLTLIGITIIMFFLHWKLALASMIPIPLLILGAWKYTFKAHDLYHMVRERAAKMNGILQDTISGMKETFAFNRQNHEIERFEKRSDAYCKGTLEVMKLWAYYSPSMMFLGSMGTVLIVLYGIGLVRGGEITVGTLVAFIGYLALFYTPINQLHSLNHMLQHALASSERLFEIIDAQPEVKEPENPVVPSIHVRGHIDFRDIHFSYVEGKEVLHGVSFDIEPGETIALAGHTGSGKSTLVKLLMRFYDPTAGEVRIDGYPLRELSLSYLREQIGLVSQEPFLFNGTVADNIRYGNLEASDEDIRRAAKAANAAGFIEKLPNGYDTLIGERGVKLSGGERHRLAIARVFLKDPPIVVLDEATASVDSETELQIKSALGELMAHRTTLIIAHRLSTLEDADRIVVLQEGTLVESGTHEDLIQGNTSYANLFRSQLHL
ncbi:Lipid A export ATP-binding/permease protein MsbA [Nitrospina gracilis 3/211]|uniref:Lipid A export ATP-binding/permease protein MsbA n=1 Tax=Nitrospina gracilis (strain 3/211) TaxID=1266370 RepID=M1ZF20_NITG3|nr:MULTISPECIES: ABC transporter ATP-binding protein [Nitrospina]MCF8722075.1 ATP-binding cassette subfamily B protein/subfamily B ATP-binding cassette protein MsbA [Nitrospina sp. Nb-3]CCQ92207.1 Lipid A export ATP-binding/permease protein MsbA [Nitrospina gracilis 3/211]